MEKYLSHQLNSLEHLFFDMETSGFNSDVSSLQLYQVASDPSGLDEPSSYAAQAENLFSHLCSKIEKTPAFKRKLFKVPMGVDHPYWVEDFSFDLLDHFQHIRLEQGATWEQLMEEVSRLQNRNLEKQKPLWVGALISGFQPPEGLKTGNVALYLKMHHALIDGETGRDIQRSLHSIVPEEFETYVGRGEVPPQGLMHQRANFKAIAKSYPNNFRKSLSSAIFIGKQLTSITKKVDSDIKNWTPFSKRNLNFRSQEIGQIKQKVTEFMGVPTKFNPRHIGYDCIVDARFFDIHRLRKIRELVPGATLSDVIFAGIAGGIHRYLDRLGDDTSFPLKVAVPINIRDDTKESAQVMMTVHYSQLFSNIKDPKERLEKTVQRNLKMKESSSLKNSKSLMKFLQVAPLAMSSPIAKMTAWTLGKSPLVGAHTAITNVPGVPSDLYLGSAKMVGMMGMAPVVGRIGLVHGVFSTPDTLSVSVTVGSKVSVDTTKYLEAIEQSFEEYLELI